MSLQKHILGIFPCLCLLLVTAGDGHATSSSSCKSEQKMVDKQEKRVDRFELKLENLINRNDNRRLNFQAIADRWSEEATRQRKLYQTGCLTQGLFGGNFSKCQQRALAAANKANAKRNAALSRLNRHNSQAAAREANSQAKLDSERAKLTDYEQQLQQCLNAPNP